MLSIVVPDAPWTSILFSVFSSVKDEQGVCNDDSVALRFPQYFVAVVDMRSMGAEMPDEGR